MTSASASSISRKVSQETVRISRRSPCSSSYGHVRPASAISSSAASQRSSSAGPSAWRASASRPMRSRHLLPHERHRHHQVLVRPQARTRRQRHLGAERLAQPRAGLSRQQAPCGALRRSAALPLARAQGAELEEELGLRADRRVVGRVGAVEHLLGRGLGEQRAYVEGVPERRVEADVRMAQRGRRVQIGDRAVREHDLRARVALEQPGEVARQRAARRGPCGTASARLARRPARRRRPARGARSRSRAGSCAA